MLFLFFKSDDFKGTYALLSKSVDKNPAKYERGVNHEVDLKRQSKPDQRVRVNEKGRQ